MKKKKQKKKKINWGILFLRHSPCNCWGKRQKEKRDRKRVERTIKNLWIESYGANLIKNIFLLISIAKSFLLFCIDFQLSFFVSYAWTRFRKGVDTDFVNLAWLYDFYIIVELKLVTMVLKSFNNLLRLCEKLVPIVIWQVFVVLRHLMSLFDLKLL